MDNTVLNAIIALVTYLSLVSAAAERCTEILKRLCTLDARLPEHYRVVVYQLISTILCGLMAWLQPPEANLAGLHNLRPEFLVIVVALAGSGGSALWHDLLGMLNAQKVTMQNSGK